MYWYRDISVSWIINIVAATHVTVLLKCPPLQFGRSLQYGTRTMSANFVHIERCRLSSTQKLIKSTHWWNSLPPEASYVQEITVFNYFYTLIYSCCMFFVVCILVVVCDWVSLDC